MTCYPVQYVHWYVTLEVANVFKAYPINVDTPDSHNFSFAAVWPSRQDLNSLKPSRVDVVVCGA